MFSKNDTLKVKGVAILFLLFHHLFWERNYVAATVDGATEDILNILCPTAYATRLCVWIFVFLSAYGLTFQYKKWNGTTVHFIVKRLLALLSSFFFVFPFAVLFLYLSGMDFAAVYDKNICNVILDFFALSDFFGTPTLSGAWWYMCLTQVVIWIIPACFWVCKKVGILIIPYTFLLLQYLPSGIASMYGGAYIDYLLAIVLGVYFATENVFDRILKKSKKWYICVVDLLFALAVLAMLLIIRDLYVDGNVFTDPWKIASSNAALATVILVYIIAKYIKWKPIENIFSFLGKHSGNMYLIHTIFYINLKPLVYWSSNAVAIFFTLLTLSLGFSIIIECLKSVIGYNRFMGFLDEKLNRLFVKTEN